MATPPPGRKTRTPCAFYEKGSCRYGDACRFTHGISDSRELPPQGGKAAERESVAAAEGARPASPPDAKNKKPCRFFVKGKCTRGKGCPFLHSGGDDSGSAASVDGSNKDHDQDQDTPGTGKKYAVQQSKATAKVKVKAKANASVKASPRVSRERDDDGAATVTAAKRAAPGEAAAGAARVAARAPRIKPRLGGGGGSSLPPPPSKVNDGGAVKAAAPAATAGGTAGSWAGIVKRATAATYTKRASTPGGDGSTTGTGSTGSTSSVDGDASAAVASAAARVKAFKAAHLAAKKTARAAGAAASAAAAAASAGGGSAAAATAAAAVGTNARISDTFGEQTTSAAGRKQRKQQQQQVASATSGSPDAPKDGKKKSKRANTKPCAFFLRGRCRYGDGCKFSHDVARESDGDEEDGEEGALAAAKEAALDQAERIQSRKAECGICLEVVRKSERVKGRTFGILTGCRHIYCLSCITEWRDKSKSHECPECRVPSPVVVPSKTLVTDPDRKARLLSSFQKSLARSG